MPCHAAYLLEAVGQSVPKPATRALSLVLQPVARARSRAYLIVSSGIIFATDMKVSGALKEVELLVELENAVLALLITENHRSNVRTDGS